MVFLFVPLILTFIIGMIILVWKRLKVFQYIPSWTGIPAGFLCVGTGFITLTQMFYALSIAPDITVIVTLMFALIPIILGYVILRILFKNLEKLKIGNRVVLVVCGVLGLFFWAGFLIGPLLTIFTALLPSKTILKNNSSR